MADMADISSLFMASQPEPHRALASGTLRLPPAISPLLAVAAGVTHHTAARPGAPEVRPAAHLEQQNTLQVKARREAVPTGGWAGRAGRWELTHLTCPAGGNVACESGRLQFQDPRDSRRGPGRGPAARVAARPPAIYGPALGGKRLAAFALQLPSPFCSAFRWGVPRCSAPSHTPTRTHGEIKMNEIAARAPLDRQPVRLQPLWIRRMKTMRGDTRVHRRTTRGPECRVQCRVQCRRKTRGAMRRPHVNTEQ